MLRHARMGVPDVELHQADVASLPFPDGTFDLAVMRLGARVLNAIPSISTLAPVASVEEFGRAVFAQLDFRIEARNNLRFRDVYIRGGPNAGPAVGPTPRISFPPPAA